MPIEGAHVEDSNRHIFVTTGPDGSYRIPDVSAGGAFIYFAKTGFTSLSRQFTVTGDTVLDVSLVRN